MIVIETRFSPCTNTRGSAIAAKQIGGDSVTNGKRLRMAYDHAADTRVNHLRAAQALLEETQGAYAGHYSEPHIAWTARGYLFAFI